jgi:uncharacterized protein (DUF2126 family)
MNAWTLHVSRRCDEILSAHGVGMTLGGEPTFVPVRPDGPEWNYAAVGPTKLGFAKKLAARILRDHMTGGVEFFSPGKSYPGELNPRWAIRLLANRDGSPVFPRPAGGAPTKLSLEDFQKRVASGLGVAARWRTFSDPLAPDDVVRVLLLDECGGKWKSFAWPHGRLALTSAEGPAGLRLPLHLLPSGVPARALTLEWRGDRLAIFFPPVLQAPFKTLLAVVGGALRAARIGRFDLQGSTPPDESLSWVQVGLTADPGVLEVNLPACENWREYEQWISAVTGAAEASGMRSWKCRPGGHPEGTGGGNHLLWGGPTIDRNPFFSRPAWMASILRYWQHHPSLAYMFTGCYVGASSQAPRADESARDRYDLTMALDFLESLPPGDHRHLISETLRHLQTDVTGNSHRSEISLDKFWNVGWTSGTLGLIEFRAIETLPNAPWTGAVALLWSALAAWLLENPRRGKLRDLSTQLHDRFFLPSILWNDLREIFADLAGAGFLIDEKVFRAIWEWKFPVLLRAGKPGASFEVRRAHESWPLLCETPVDGGTTSRFVDTSMERLEIFADPAFARSHKIRAANRPLELKPQPDGSYLAGLRYRRTNLYPSLHPGLPPQVPLEILLDGPDGLRRFVLGANDRSFRRAAASAPRAPGRPCKSAHRGDLTYDLRIV